MNKYCLLLACLFITTVSLAAQNSIAVKDFWHPKYLGERLAYCNLDETKCGKSVADSYCQLLGYDYAKHFNVANNLGLVHYLSTRARCKGWRCKGFMNIGCAESLKQKPAPDYYYRKKRFAYPRYQDYRVDWCYKDNSDCGQRAAVSFCRRMGYMNVSDFKKQPTIHASRTLGSKKLCFGKQCTGFQYIVCRR